MIRHRALGALALSAAMVVVLAVVATRQVSAGAVLSPGLVAALVIGPMAALIVCGVLVADERRQRRSAEMALRMALVESEARADSHSRELTDCLARLQVSEAHYLDASTRAELATRLKDEFLGTASHELRTPLHTIVGWVHILKQPSLTEAQRIHAVEAIERNARAQTTLIANLLDVSQLQQGQFTLALAPVDLRSVLQDALQSMTGTAAEGEVEMMLETSAEPLVVNADRQRLQQVVWHLLSNAVRFTPKRGIVRVQADRMGSRARLRVEDSGEGIDPEFLPHVFETFRQGPSKAMRAGMGLGLTIVRQLVELHSGTITADSPGIGRGAVFVATFPLASTSIAGPPAALAS